VVGPGGLQEAAAGDRFRCDRRRRRGAAQEAPAPDVYIKALARLGLSAAECLAIEDSANGLISASRAGIAVVIARSTYFRDDDFAEALLVVDDLSELA
jgi:beta-phosphoglucomutase-like phosphatase (HAD superfamily)